MGNPLDPMSGARKVGESGASRRATNAGYYESKSVLGSLWWAVKDTARSVRQHATTGWSAESSQQARLRLAGAGTAGSLSLPVAQNSLVNALDPVAGKTSRIAMNSATSVASSASAAAGKSLPAAIKASGGGGGAGGFRRFMGGAGGFAKGTGIGLGKYAAGSVAFGTLAFGASLLIGGAIGLGYAPFEAMRATRNSREEEEMQALRRMGATVQTGPFGTGDRPYGMNSNFNNASGMTLALHYASHGSGIRNPTWGMIGKATGFNTQSAATNMGLRVMGGW